MRARVRALPDPPASAWINVKAAILAVRDKLGIAAARQAVAEGLTNAGMKADTPVQEVQFHPEAWKSVIAACDAKCGIEYCPHHKLLKVEACEDCDFEELRREAEKELRW